MYDVCIELEEEEGSDHHVGYTCPLTWPQAAAAIFATQPSLQPRPEIAGASETPEMSKI